MMARCFVVIIAVVAFAESACREFKAPGFACAGQGGCYEEEECCNGVCVQRSTCAALDAGPDASADTTPPETTLDGGALTLGLYATSATRSILFFCNETPCTFACILDEAGVSCPAAPFVTASLSDGPHLFSVRAIDDAGNADPTPALFSWTIDTTPPLATYAVDAGNPVPFGTALSIAGTSSDFVSQVALVELSTDGGAWVSIASAAGPFVANFVANAFATTPLIRAHDYAGNVSTTDGGGAIYGAGLPASDLFGYPTAEFTRGICPGMDGVYGLSAPSDLAVDVGLRRLYVADRGHNRIVIHNLSQDAGVVDVAADAVLGQADLDRCGGEVSASRMKAPEGVATNGNEVFVSDTGNNRVLIFTNMGGTLQVGKSATYVLGQTDFAAAAPGSGAAGMKQPIGIAYDNVQQWLFVADSDNSRVLVFVTDGGAGGWSNGMSAAYVIGQPDLDASTGATSSTRLFYPKGLAWDSAKRRLYVADSYNSRVVAFNLGAQMSSGMDASAVIGAADFDTVQQGLAPDRLSNPVGVRHDPSSNRVFVADQGNNRVLVYVLDGGEIVNGLSAVKVLGQPDYGGADAGITQSRFTQPGGVAVLSGGSQLAVADTEAHRIMLFDVGAISNGMNASNVIGHVDEDGGPLFSTGCATTSRSAFGPLSVALDDANRRLFVSESMGTLTHSRVLVFDLDDAGAGLDRLADKVLGQSNFSHCGKNFTAGGVASVAGMAVDSIRNRLYVADNNYHRILAFNLASLANGMNADFVLGQPNFDAGSPATSQAGLKQPNGLAIDEAQDRLFVADNGNNRVLMFDTSVIANGMDAKVVLGQALFTTGSAGVSQSTLNSPSGVAFQPSTKRLFVADTLSNRVMVWDATNPTNGAAAAFVLGQSSFSVGAPADGGPNATGIRAPIGVAIDDARGRLFVSASYENRIVMFDVRALANGLPASNVLGQTSLAGGDAGLSQTMMDTPTAITLSRTGKRLYAIDQGNTRVLVFDVAP